MVGVSLRGVAKVYPGNVEALDDVTLDVGAGELLVLLGPSGSGKSTLLRLISGLDTLTRGTIHIEGRPVAGVPPHRRGVGFVSQRAMLYPHLSVRDNLRFGLEGKDEHAVREVVRLLQLDDLLERRPAELSGGQQQRVALGRALVRKKGVLLLDEPFSSLDGPLRWELHRELHLLQRQLRATMMLVTHEQESLSLADRLAVLHQGRLVQVGTPDEIHDHPASSFVARLVGWPPINLVPGDLLPLMPTGESLPGHRFPGRQVLVGLRSAQVRVPGSEPRKAGEVVLEMTLASDQPPRATGLVYLERGALRLIGRAERRLPPTGTVPVALDMGAAHLFDATTGLASRPGR